MNFSVEQKKRYRLYFRIGMAYLALWMIVDLGSHPDVFFQKYFLNEIWRVIYIIPLNYFFFEKVLPRISRKRIIKSFLLIALMIFLCSAGLYIWRSIGKHLYIFTPIKTFKSVGDAVGEQFGASLFSIIFFSVLRHIHFYRLLKKDTQQLRIEKQEAELNYLKSQTNPHFLFNTLNNIYSLARDKSDLAPESIMRLSKILRFMLYEAGGEFIAIEQELKIINDYIALEELRYDDSLRISFKYDIEDMKQALPPLLLIPLVENAFKHGVSETRHRPFVDIFLSVNQRQLKLQVKNSADQAAVDSGIRENIGLSNLRRQLQLLYKEYDLAFKQEESVFAATLKINLGSHV